MGAEQTANPLAQFAIIPYIVIFFIFYFIVIKPQRQKQKEFKETLQNLAKNDQVITSSGIHGTVVNIKDKTIVLRVDDNVKIEFEKDVISSVIKSTNKS